MINVNLRPGVKRKRQGTDLAGTFAGFKDLGSKIKDPLLLLAVAAWAVVLVGLGGMWGVNRAQLSKLEPELARAKAENKRFRTFVQERHKAEATRDSVLRQIDVIRSVDGTRYLWPHVLDEVSQAVPQYTWLIDINSKEILPDTLADSTGTARPTIELTINGRTMDIQAYTRLLRQLEASPWLTNVTPVTMQTVVEKDHAVTAFSVKATVDRGDSSLIRTVPLRASVR